MCKFYDTKIKKSNNRMFTIMEIFKFIVQTIKKLFTIFNS